MRLILLVAVAITVATGCQTSPRINRHIETLNGEKRILEDELYELEYDYEDALEELEQLRSENARLHQRLGTLPDARPSSAPRRSESNKKSSSSGPDLAPPMIDEGLLTEPKIEIPDQPPGQRNLPAPRSSSPAPAVPMTFRPPAPPDPADVIKLALDPPGLATTQKRQNISSSDQASMDIGDPRVTHLYVNPLLTGGSDFDHQPGDDGVVIALEPRNQNNGFVPLAGPISVVLVDPTRDDGSARVARWDLEAQDTQQAIQASNSLQGIQLRLPWPDGIPDNSRLQLFVRYVTVDGRQLEASRDIFVTLPGQYSQRWTPRSSGRTTMSDARQSQDVQPVGHVEEIQSTHEPTISPSDSTSENAPSWQPLR